MALLGPAPNVTTMQETTTKKQAEIRRSAPVRILDPRSPEALHMARVELAQAQNSLYNVLGHAPQNVVFNPLLQTQYAPYSAQWNAPWPTAAIGYPLPGNAEFKAPRAPLYDLADDGTSFVVRIELPGIQAEQAYVVCHDRVLLVQVLPSSEVDPPVLLQTERATGTPVGRTIPLPAEIQPSGCKARLADGVLTVTLPKLVPTEAPRRLEVQA
ncbi:MAG TPA: Hsp20/alpha crystallin family protein [Candidatus Thermoplasmatota archaeon]|nr:Hsp20/alpha crystallin family protein [Candidatus Thermoplasmatota archaeon]